jgi:polyisoprenoid-binding protein YceI
VSEQGKDSFLQQSLREIRSEHMDFDKSFRKNHRFEIVAAVVCGSSLLGLISSPPSGAAAKAAKISAAKVGGVCKSAGAVSGTLVCTKKASRLVWAKPAAAATPGAPAAPAAGSATPTASAAPAASPAPAAGQTGIAGNWNATTDSVIGYRVKEILDGQSIEAAGRTNAITGTLVIEDTTAKSVSLTVDVTKLESDKAQRDKQVQGRILDTQKFPTAKLVLKSPIPFGKVPGDKEVVSIDTKLSLTIKAATRDLEVPIKARRVGATLEITGSIPIRWADWGIDNPSLPPFVTTDDNGILEFLVVFAR